MPHPLAAYLPPPSPGPIAARDPLATALTVSSSAEPQRHGRSLSVLLGTQAGTFRAISLRSASITPAAVLLSCALMLVICCARPLLRRARARAPSRSTQQVDELPCQELAAAKATDPFEVRRRPKQAEDTASLLQKTQSGLEGTS